MWINALDEISSTLSVNLRGFVSRFYWFYSPIKNTWVEIYEGNQKLGEAQTNRKGFFCLPHLFSTPGIHRLQIYPKGRFGSKENLTVLITQPGEEALVCDIDHTLMSVSALSFILNRQVAPMPKAKETLKLLLSKYRIVYLTHRETRFAHITKNWLEKNGLPPGPVFLWSYKHHPLHNEKYKTKALNRITQRGEVHLKIAFGDKQSDMDAYRKAGIETIYRILNLNDWEKINQEIIDAIKNEPYRQSDSL